jgi:hypothetical protein
MLAVPLAGLGWAAAVNNNTLLLCLHLTANCVNSKQIRACSLLVFKIQNAK